MSSHCSSDISLAISSGLVISTSLPAARRTQADDALQTSSHCVDDYVQFLVYVTNAYKSHLSGSRTRFNKSMVPVETSNSVKIYAVLCQIF